jgi:hypothetical protein
MLFYERINTTQLVSSTGWDRRGHLSLSREGEPFILCGTTRLGQQVVGKKREVGAISVMRSGVMCASGEKRTKKSSQDIAIPGPGWIRLILLDIYQRFSYLGTDSSFPSFRTGSPSGNRSGWCFWLGQRPPRGHPGQDRLQAQVVLFNQRGF